MRRLLKTLGAILLFALVALCFAPFVVPPFLDRIYYQGPVSDHFDGERFFNPGVPPRQSRNPRRFFNRIIGDDSRAVWPDSVPVTPTRPPARVQGETMRVTFIGHASVLIQTQGLNILADPIWSQRASPFSFVGPQRARQPGVRFDDLPPIDLVLISHNHYDHLDLPTLKRLWKRDRPRIVTSLGNDTILAGEGIHSIAADWDGRVPVRPGIEIVVERNHHWSSRWGSDRNRALWSGFTIVLPGGNIFFAGDTGYGDGSWSRKPPRAARFGSRSCRSALTSRAT